MPNPRKFTLHRILTQAMLAVLVFLALYVPLNTYFHINYLRLPDFSYRPMPPVQVEVQTSLIDGMEMVLVPGGEFTMGATDKDRQAYPPERPAHIVFLDAFWVDRTEVTNAQYALCVQAGACEPPTAFGVQKTDSVTRDWYYGNPEFDAYPVINVDWDAAQAYCAWTGRRLPTEAEWEKAARGTDMRWYPWGSRNVRGAYLNLADRGTRREHSYNLVDDGYDDTSPTGNYPKGASPYGAYDMAGNVWEWVSDWYGRDYYSQSPYANPPGPDAGEDKVLRGGSYNNSNWAVRTTARSRLAPIYAYAYIGFRCVQPAAGAPQ